MSDSVINYFNNILVHKTITKDMLVDKLGLVRDKAFSFSDANITSQCKDVLSSILGLQMALFGCMFPIFNGAIIILLYLYHYILRLLTNICNVLSNTNNTTAVEISHELLNNNLYTVITVIFIGLIMSCIILVLFKYFIRLFVFISCIFICVEGPVRGIFIQYFTDGVIIPLIFGILMGSVLMVYFEKVFKKSVLIVLFSVVGCALLFIGVGEISNIRYPIAESIITLSAPTAPIINIVKSSVLFFFTVGASIVIQIFI
ncbi:hypothetical protein NEPAR06_0479 [Nematocida parisii]|uniref:Uncharacterized protein n=1 Tax=Nematocida parisii (strain ERTm3) TaxID=935791 RepID=I3EJH8_NEMP3|nr:uncharacterized protein NEPG_01094 [Nematocida parisii ERTm1]EIJ89375.1 hypothetical protein NEQG_00145 [Nematocida parisii ERTm3]KAI5127423.1 hypothetical protein NEPAR08_0864 [Nematocida parisii]EIJ94426.1 hypothetical protein NEPG_01094 [Nematocida parisii ERTm1]KAI5129060.1 hypothetical protein NEPAR03_1506 [Nematocida parisii]KAI5141334.1 hypothetical protein NEPAR04_0896 [Nematocida parisii]|eukprot:XP_013058922.1 hypothetical protein NEPG_01094 [Nematocida parisii ERTm1]